jgi:hypothetical protein
MENTLPRTRNQRNKYFRSVTTRKINITVKVSCYEKKIQTQRENSERRKISSEDESKRGSVVEHVKDIDQESTRVGAHTTTRDARIRT